MAPLGAATLARLGRHPGDPAQRRDGFARATKGLCQSVEKASPDRVISIALDDDGDASSASPSLFLSLHPEPSPASKGGDDEGGEEVFLHPAWRSLLLGQDGVSRPEAFAVVRPVTAALPRLKTVWAVPESEDDWEILESNASLIQDTLLNQLKVVGRGSLVVIFCKSISINVKIEGLDPDCEVGTLDNQTDFAVKPRPRAAQASADAATNASMPSAKTTGYDPSQELLERLSERGEAFLGGRPKRLRVVCKADDAFLSDCGAGLTVGVVTGARKAKGGVLLQLERSPKSAGDVSERPCFPLLCRSGQDIIASEIPHLVVSASLARAMQLKLGDRLWSAPATPPLDSIDHRAKLVLKGDDVEKLLESVDGVSAKLFCSDDQDESVVVPARCGFDAQVGDQALRVSNNADQAIFASKRDIQDRLAFEKMPSDVPVAKETSSDKGSPNSLPIVDDLTDHLFDSGLSSVLIVGERGSGKTTALDSLREVLQAQTIYYVQVMACKRLIGRRPDLVLRELSEAVSECLYRWPSLLALDDVDALCRAREDGGGGVNWAEDMHLSSLSTSVLEVLDRARDLKVKVVSTATDAERLHPALRPGRGSHVFDGTLKIAKPNHAERMDILSHHLKSEKLLSLLTLQDSEERLKAPTEGFTPADLREVAKAIELEDIKGADLTPETLERVASRHRPLSLWSARLDPPAPSQKWEAVGGMGQAKQILVETIVWPGKYPRLFAKCPCQRTSGLLLHGPPGTGKTMLVGAAARKANVNFIHIKGPELLSKYIGASEAAVRSTFERARAAQPVVLFFDEFDSLAPRRGHDSTGVTDRVVNQLLTQLDGVEGRGEGGEAVFVVAATSRPDLIDPALLRPGRIDRKVYCPVPNEFDRLEILRCQTTELSLTPQAEEKLGELATKTDGYTGADLRAVCINARLLALKERLKGDVEDPDKESADLASEMSVEGRRKLLHFYPAEQKWREEEEEAKMGSPSCVAAAAPAATSAGGSTSNGRQRRSRPTVVGHRQVEAVITWDHLLAALGDTRPSLSRQRKEEEKDQQRFIGIGSRTQPVPGIKETLA